MAIVVKITKEWRSRNQGHVRFDLSIAQTHGPRTKENISHEINKPQSTISSHTVPSP